MDQVGDVLVEILRPDIDGGELVTQTVPSAA